MDLRTILNPVNPSSSLPMSEKHAAAILMAMSSSDTQSPSFQSQAKPSHSAPSYMPLPPQKSPITNSPARQCAAPQPNCSRTPAYSDRNKNVPKPDTNAKSNPITLTRLPPLDVLRRMRNEELRATQARGTQSMHESQPMTHKQVQRQLDGTKKRKVGMEDERVIVGQGQRVSEERKGQDRRSVKRKKCDTEATEIKVVDGWTCYVRE